LWLKRGPQSPRAAPWPLLSLQEEVVLVRTAILPARPRCGRRLGRGVMTFNDGTCLCVRGIPESCHEADLDALFKSYGRVCSVRVPLEPVSKGHRGYAFVTMACTAEAHACIQALNGVEFSGCRLLVEISKRATPHSKTPGVYFGLPPGGRKVGDVSHSRRRHEAASAGAVSASRAARSAGRSSSRCASLEKAQSCEKAAVAEPLSEPAATATAPPPPVGRGRGGRVAEPPPMEPAVEPGGEPLIEEDPLSAADPRERPPGASEHPPESPRDSRISQLEEATRRVIAKQTVDGLLLQFQQHGFEDPRAATHECLKVALEFLGVPTGSAPISAAEAAAKQQMMGSQPPVLVGPDEFKNPSSFLRIYGDPLAATASRRPGCQPESHQDGNWRCEPCSNVNFPRRQRCHKCHAPRGPNGDAIVLSYCLRVYETLLKGKTCE